MHVHPSSPRKRKSPATIDRARLGERLRGLRKARGLTLKALSARSGVALSTLSKIELGQISVSYEKLLAAARALDAEIDALFDPRAELNGAAAPVAVRSTVAEAPSYDAGPYRYRMLAAGFPGRQMTPMHGTIVARDPAQFADYVRHPGQEFVMVLSGSVRIRFETGAVIELKRQESAYFDSGTGHIYLSTGAGDAQVVVVMSER